MTRHRTPLNIPLSRSWPQSVKVAMLQVISLAQLEAAKKVARQSRMKLNRSTSCRICKPLELIAS